MFYKKINQKISDFIINNDREPNQIIMNNEDFLEFKQLTENHIQLNIDVNGKIKYMGKEIIRTLNINKGEIRVGLFN